MIAPTKEYIGKCVRGCMTAGISDPEKAIPAMVEALKNIMVLVDNQNAKLMKRDLVEDSVYMHAKQALEGSPNGPHLPTKTGRDNDADAASVDGG